MRDRVERALATVRLDPAHFARRMPLRLSGGQRQRVALARALVLEPAILLLDEPLGALDLQLRKDMQRELRALNRELGITFIYVTHDQDEALAMSDRIAVMERARVAQVGTPAEIYEQPQSVFVASFIGASNVLSGRVSEAAAGRLTVALAKGRTFEVPAGEATPPGRVVQVVVRPERMHLAPPGAATQGNCLYGVVSEVFYHGGTIQVQVRLEAGADLTVELPNDGTRRPPLPWTPGRPVQVGWHPEDGQALPAPEQDR
jgi:spermidine/putrescine transport system ATP-binding protein